MGRAHEAQLTSPNLNLRLSMFVQGNIHRLRSSLVILQIQKQNQSEIRPTTTRQSA